MNHDRIEMETAATKFLRFSASEMLEQATQTSLCQASAMMSEPMIGRTLGCYRGTMIGLPSLRTGD